MSALTDVADTSVTVASVAAATGFSVVRHIKEGHPSMKPILGGMMLGAFLLFIAMFSPSWAKAIAILVMATSALVNGAVVFGVANTVAGA